MVKERKLLIDLLVTSWENRNYNKYWEDPLGEVNKVLEKRRQMTTYQPIQHLVDDYKLQMGELVLSWFQDKNYGFKNKTFREFVEAKWVMNNVSK